MSAAHPCSGCVAGCCREVHVLPTGHDVFRIAEAKKISIASFTFLRSRGRVDGTFRIRLFGGDDPETPHARLELAKVDDEGEFSRRCAFLVTAGPWGEGARCGIYDVRPADCALYPTSRADDRIVISRRLPYCPPGVWNLSFVDEKGELALHVRRQLEQAIYERVVERWNASLSPVAGPVEPGAFYPFLVASYRRLGADSSSLTAAVGSRARISDQAALRARVDQLLDEAEATRNDA